MVRELSITPIPVDRPPFPLAKNVSVPVYFTIQPGGAYVYTLRPGLIAAPICMEDGSFEPSAGFIDATSLPSTASYTLFVDPHGAATGA